MSVKSGPVLSTTVTVAVACEVAPLGSVTVSRTLVVPNGNGPAGDWTIVIGSPSGSKDRSSTEAIAVHSGPAETVIFLALATGTWLIVEQFTEHPKTFRL